MSLCWEGWGLEEAGGVLALMKVPSHQVLAAWTAVDSAVPGEPCAPSSGASPGRPVHTERTGSLGLDREVEQGILGEPRLGAGGTL